MGDLHGRLIAFDLDGTLVDSRRDLADSANQLIEELGGRPLSERAIGAMVGEGAALLVKRALAAAGLGDHPGGLPRFLQIYDERLLCHTVLYDGIAEAVRAARRHARVAVVTNKPVGPTERLLHGLGLRPFVDEVIGGDQEYPRKPDPASLLALITRACARPSRALLIGDSRIDCQTARRAGTRCCLARYGFGRETLQEEDLAGVDWMVETPRELPDVFLSFTAGE